MTTEDPSLWVRGYRAGWLYFYDYTRMLRLAPWPGVTLEIRGENGLWSAVPHESAIRLLPWVQWASTSVTYIGSDLWCEMNGQMVTGYALPSVERKVAWENLLIEKYLRASPIDLGATTTACGLNVGPSDLYSRRISPFGLIYLLARVPEFSDFLAHDFNLVLFFANHRGACPPLRSASWDDFRVAARGRRRDLVEWVGMPPRESSRALLRKLTPDALQFLPGATELLCEPVLMNTLLNGPSVNGAMLQLLSCVALRPLVSARLVQQLYRRGMWFASNLSLIVGLANHGVLQLKSGTELLALVEGGTLSQAALTGILVDLPLPEAPFRTDPDVEAICTTHALVREGMEMNHCADSLYHLFAAVTGQICFYRVHQPVRATLCLEWRCGAWYFSEIRGWGNEALTTREVEIALRSFPASGYLQGCGITWAAMDAADVGT